MAAMANGLTVNGVRRVLSRSGRLRNAGIQAEVSLDTLREKVNVSAVCGF